MIDYTETDLCFIRCSKNRRIRLTPTAGIVADYFLYQNYLIMEGIKMMEIILNRDVLNSANVKTRSQNIVKMFILKDMNNCLCFKYFCYKNNEIIYIGSVKLLIDEEDKRKLS